MFVFDGISEESYQAVKDIYNRDLGIWWNYPVNDYYIIDGNRNIKLALGPIEKLPKAKPNSIFYNPMEQPLFSKISIGTGADYALLLIPMFQQHHGIKSLKNNLEISHQL